ncbi:hypothetical protein [Erythrobacter sp.]|uniref:hypothetical protein n=1 Tax=Erythrobacter sp. TaxID=1042 RepID=UPI0025EDFD0F|nr:hypothetical protein [Erythrobacter sp.]
MSKSPLANSKTALVFAAMTIISTLMMVGPRDGNGVLDATIDRFAKQRETAPEQAPTVSEKPRVIAEPLDPASGWGGTTAPVFGDYSAEEVIPDEPETPSGPNRPSRSTSRNAAPPVPVGGPVTPDFPGVPVPRPDRAGAPD